MLLQQKLVIPCLIKPVISLRILGQSLGKSNAFPSLPMIKPSIKSGCLISLPLNSRCLRGRPDGQIIYSITWNLLEFLEAWLGKSLEYPRDAHAITRPICRSNYLDSVRAPGNWRPRWRRDAWMATCAWRATPRELHVQIQRGSRIVRVSRVSLEQEVPWSRWVFEAFP